MSRFFIAVAGIALFWSVTNTGSAQPRPPLEPRGRWPSEFKGYGTTEEAAQAAARNKVIDDLADYLRKQSPPLLESTPAEAPLDEAVRKRLGELANKYLLEDIDGEAGKDLEAMNGVRAKTWVFSSLEHPNWNSVLQAEAAAQRQGRAADHRHWAGRAFLVIGALLIVGYGYVRVDEATGSKYTRWLRTASVAALALLGVAWWQL